MEGTEDFFVDVCADDGGKNICTLAKAQNGKESRWIGHRMFLDEAGERARRLCSAGNFKLRCHYTLIPDSR